MRKILITIACLSAMLLFANLAQAQEMKIGVFHISKIYSESSAGKAVDAKLQQKGKEMEAELNSQGAKVKQMEEELKALAKEAEEKGPAMSEQARLTKAQEFREKAMAFEKAKTDLQRRALEMQQEGAKYEAELKQPIVDVLMQVVVDYGTKNGYTAIFEGRNGGVVYMPVEYDLSDELLPLFEAAWKNR